MSFCFFPKEFRTGPKLQDRKMSKFLGKFRKFHIFNLIGHRVRNDFSGHRFGGCQII